MTMKVLGGKNMPSYWERFDRLQRMAHKLRGKNGPPKGVFRFSSFEEFNKWKEETYRSLPEPPKRTTS